MRKVDTHMLHDADNARAEIFEGASHSTSLLYETIYLCWCYIIRFGSTQMANEIINIFQPRAAANVLNFTHLLDVLDAI